MSAGWNDILSKCYAEILCPQDKFSRTGLVRCTIMSMQSKDGPGRGDEWLWQSLNVLEYMGIETGDSEFDETTGVLNVNLGQLNEKVPSIIDRDNVMHFAVPFEREVNPRHVVNPRVSFKLDLPYNDEEDDHILEGVHPFRNRKVPSLAEAHAADLRASVLQDQSVPLREKKDESYWCDVFNRDAMLAAVFIDDSQADSNTRRNFKNLYMEARNDKDLHQGVGVIRAVMMNAGYGKDEMPSLTSARGDGAGHIEIRPDSIMNEFTLVKYEGQSLFAVPANPMKAGDPVRSSYLAESRDSKRKKRKTIPSLNDLLEYRKKEETKMNLLDIAEDVKNGAKAHLEMVQRGVLSGPVNESSLNPETIDDYVNCYAKLLGGRARQEGKRELEDNPFNTPGYFDKFIAKLLSNTDEISFAENDDAKANWRLGWNWVNNDAPIETLKDRVDQAAKILNLTESKVDEALRYEKVNWRKFATMHVPQADMADSQRKMVNFRLEPQADESIADAVDGVEARGIDLDVRDVDIADNYANGMINSEILLMNDFEKGMNSDDEIVFKIGYTGGPSGQSMQGQPPSMNAMMEDFNPPAERDPWQDALSRNNAVAMIYVNRSIMHDMKKMRKQRADQEDKRDLPREARSEADLHKAVEIIRQSIENIYSGYPEPHNDPADYEKLYPKISRMAEQSENDAVRGYILLHPSTLDLMFSYFGNGGNGRMYVIGLTPRGISGHVYSGSSWKSQRANA